MPNHVCPHCGHEFYHRKSARKFCDNACWHAYASANPNRGTFKQGHTEASKLLVGTVRIRQRRNRVESPRAWIKVAEPNLWRLRAVLVWETGNGPVPSGHVVHHIDRDTLNDHPSNLKLITRAAHLLEHRPEFEERRARNAARARRAA